MTKRYFTPAEVEALIPELTRMMDELMPAYAEATEIRTRLHAEQQRVAQAGGGLIDRDAWRADKLRLDTVTETVRRHLERIAELGGVPKDLALGLVDFPHLRGEDEVNLCWRYGETAIRFWHGLDEGYTARKSL